MLYPQVARLDDLSDQAEQSRRAHSTAAHSPALMRMSLPSSRRTRRAPSGFRDDRQRADQSRSAVKTRQRVWIADVTAEATPFNVSISTFLRRAGISAPRRPLRRAFAERNQRRCTRQRLVFVAWFNAGVRAIDIRDNTQTIP